MSTPPARPAARQALCRASALGLDDGERGMTALAALAETSDRERACRLVPCDRCGACQHEPCASCDGQSHGARRLLAVDRGHLDACTGAWLTRGWLS